MPVIDKKIHISSKKSLSLAEFKIAYKAFEKENPTTIIDNEDLNKKDNDEVEQDNRIKTDDTFQQFLAMIPFAMWELKKGLTPIPASIKNDKNAYARYKSKRIELLKTVHRYSKTLINKETHNKLSLYSINYPDPFIDLFTAQNKSRKLTNTLVKASELVVDDGFYPVMITITTKNADLKGSREKIQYNVEKQMDLLHLFVRFIQNPSKSGKLKQLKKDKNYKNFKMLIELFQNLANSDAGVTYFRHDEFTLNTQAQSFHGHEHIMGFVPKEIAQKILDAEVALKHQNEYIHDEKKKKNLTAFDKKIGQLVTALLGRESEQCIARVVVDKNKEVNSKNEHNLPTKEEIIKSDAFKEVTKYLTTGNGTDKHAKEHAKKGEKVANNGLLKKRSKKSKVKEDSDYSKEYSFTFPFDTINAIHCALYGKRTNEKSGLLKDYWREVEADNRLNTGVFADDKNEDKELNMIENRFSSSSISDIHSEFSSKKSAVLNSENYLENEKIETNNFLYLYQKFDSKNYLACDSSVIDQRKKEIKKYNDYLNYSTFSEAILKLLNKVRYHFEFRNDISFNDYDEITIDSASLKQDFKNSIESIKTMNVVKLSKIEVVGNQAQINLSWLKDLKFFIKFLFKYEKQIAEFNNHDKNSAVFELLYMLSKNVDERIKFAENDEFESERQKMIEDFNRKISNRKLVRENEIKKIKSENLVKYQ